jgi:hypothetical protein
MNNRTKNRQQLDRTFRLPRVWSNQILREIAPLAYGEIINVSGWDDRDKEGGHYREYFVHAHAYYISNYSGERGLSDARAITNFNIDLSIPLSESLIGRFDVVYNHTTLEHIFELDIAFGNLCSLSRDLVIVVVPFAQPLHFTSSYGDYWRFTPMTLRQLFIKNGFEVVYEAANNDENAGIYLFFVGSKRPGDWKDKMPDWRPIDSLGNWIGKKRKTFPWK